MQPKRILFALLCVVGAMWVSDCLAASPNIVVILTDDQGYGDVSYTGLSSDLSTPNIDTLAAEGIRFNNFYSNSPVCSPTRASVLTGRYPGMVGVPGVIRFRPKNSWGELDPQAITLPKILRDAGYYTGHVGKWHLGTGSPNLPNERGYDHFHGFLAGRMDDYCTHSYFGQDYMRENFEPTEHAGVHATRLFTDWAIEFIEERAAGQQPFFLTLWYNAPHTPIQPPNESDPSGCPIDPDGLENRDTLVKLIEDLDHQIGRFVQALHDANAYSETLLFFVSDNGGQLDVGANNGPYRGGKIEVYEGGIRVPLVAVWPSEISSPQTSDTSGITMDLFPTILEAAGAQFPDEIDGVSLLPIMRQGGNPGLDRALIWEERSSIYRGKVNYALREEDWKLVTKDPKLPLEPGNFELYNVAPHQDPYETTDQCSTSPSICADLQVLLAEYVDREQFVRWRTSVPVSGSPFSVGELIEAEDFDAYLVDDPLVGAEGAGYHDQDSENVLGGDYRPAEGVDIGQSDTASNGFYVGNAEAGEWMAYSVEVGAAGAHLVTVSVAAPGVGGTFHIEFDGADATGPIPVPDTGSWLSWADIESSSFGLETGQHLMRVILDGNRPAGDVVANFDSFTLLSESIPPSGSKLAVTIEAVGAKAPKAAKAIDEHADGTQNLGTAWTNDGNVANAWVTLDLGSEQRVTELKVGPMGNKSLAIYVGNVLADGRVTGSPVATCTTLGEGSPLETCAIPPSYGRYLTVARTDGNWVSFYGLEVWGGSDGTSNQPPELDPIGPKTATAAQMLRFTVSASDPNVDPLHYPSPLPTELPAGASFVDYGDGTGDFIWDPVGPLGQYSVTFTVSDGELDDTETISIDVSDAIGIGQLPVTIEAVGAKAPKAAKAIDENADGSQNLGTAWSNDGNPANAWVILDLGSEQRVTELKVAPLASRSLAIYVDNVLAGGRVTGSPVATCTVPGDGSPLHTCAIPPSYGRYLTVARTGGNWISFYGLEVWGEQ